MEDDSYSVMLGMFPCTFSLPPTTIYSFSLSLYLPILPLLFTSRRKQQQSWKPVFL